MAKIRLPKLKFPLFRLPKLNNKISQKLKPLAGLPVYGGLVILFALCIAWFGAPKSDKTKSLSQLRVKTLDLGPITGLPLAEFPTKKNNAPPSGVQAHNTYLMDINSGYMLDGDNELQPVPIASMTKLMTALLTIEHQPLDKQVTVPEEAANVIGSTINLKAGEVLTVHDLLYALLLNSANDAAYTLAMIDGTKDQFVVQMNQRAKELGMTVTNYKDPAGLDDDGRSSARDVGILAGYVYRNERLSAIAQTSQTTIKSVDGKWTHQLDNSDRLVKDELRLDGMIGGKTGFTPTAGHNLVAVAQRDGHRLVAVVINTYNYDNSASAVEVRKYLTWGFQSFDWVKIAPEKPSS